MTLTLLQMRPALGPLLRWAERRKLVAAHGLDDLGYALHAILAAAFGEHAPKPFVLINPPRPRERPGADSGRNSSATRPGTHGSARARLRVRRAGGH